MSDARRYIEAWKFSRRAFLAGAGAAVAARLLPACDSAAAGPTASDRFGRLRALRSVVRASPDHLAARAAEIVAARDPARAVRFVRDNVAVLPPARAGDAATSAVRWGADGALRAGAGTMRERAELLASMLNRMGATTRVISAAMPAGVTAATLYRTRAPGFVVDPAWLSSLYEADAASLTASNGPTPDSDVTSLVDALIAAMPAAAAAVPQPFDGFASTVPLVEYSLGGQTRWAFALGDVDEVTTAPASLAGTLPAPTYPSVALRLLALSADLPGAPTTGKLVELARGSWTTDMLAGRRLTIAFSPADPAAALGAPPESVAVRAPVISLHGSPIASESFRPSGEPKPLPAVIGAPFTASGAVFQSSSLPGGPLSGPYGALPTLGAPAHAAALAAVQKIEAVAHGGAFPDVQLTIAALDAAGNAVAGLDGADFVITDEAKGQTFALLSNTSNGPAKVMLAYDCSGSVAWPTPADKAAFEDKLANALVAGAGLAAYDLGVAPIGDAPAAGYVAPDATAIRSTLGSCVSTSDVWRTLGDVALAAGVSAVVLVSDFQASDLPAGIPALKQRLVASGLAVAAIPVGSSVEQATLDEVVRVAGATKLDVASPTFAAELSDFVSAVARRAQRSAYRVTYRVPTEQQANLGHRAVAVTLLGGTAPIASAAYDVPAVAERGAMGLGGLYLELSVDGVTTTRWLTGPRPDRFGAFAAPSPAELAATRDLVSGLITVAFEPGSPTTAANADDLLSSILSFEPVAGAIGKTNEEALTAGADVQLYNAALAALVDPLRATATDLTVAPRCLRVAIMTESAGYPGFVRRIDVVPELNATQVATLDGAAAFRAAMKTTVSLSNREGASSATSASGKLRGAGLQYLAPFDDSSKLVGFSVEDAARWAPVLEQYGTWHRFVPNAASTDAMWVTDPQTGTTVAVFLDGTGGGADCANARWNAALQAALAALSFYSMLKAITCELPGMGKFACVGAIVGSVGAGVAAIFAAHYLDSVSFADICALVITVITAWGPSELGVLVTLGTISLSVLEAGKSLNEHCP